MGRHCELRDAGCGAAGARRAWLHPGQHIDLIGSFTPQMREADDEVMVRAAIYVDTRAGALADSGELVHALAAASISTQTFAARLSELARGSVSGRRVPGEITLFKSVGCAAGDLAAAEAGPLRVRKLAPWLCSS